MGKISSGKTLLMSMRAHAIAPSPNVRGYFSSGDPDNVLTYLISYPNLPEISSGNISSLLMYLDNTHPLTIKPNSDSYRIASSIALRGLGEKITNLGTTVSGDFDYTFTYQ
ncbi:hypothetical protein E8Q25_22540 [Salmonella enterica]|nr:hypothetical protein [Salmonella enterica subsp. enterica serovar Bonariensis]EBU3703471.1 hypothetical protein [Salmonella enterica]